MKNNRIVMMGLDAIGSNFSRELMRYLSCLQNDSKFSIALSFVDDKDVIEDDLYNQFFLRKDIGFNKAGTMKLLWECMFKKNDNIRLSSYSYDFREQEKIVYDCFGKSSYYDELKILIVGSDMSREQRVRIHDEYKKMKSAVILVYHNTGISVGLRSFDCEVMPLPEKALQDAKPIYTLGESLFYAHLMFTYVVNILSNQTIGVSPLKLDYSKLATGEENKFPPVIKNEFYKFSNKGKTAIVCVGVGGTGGNFCKDIVKVMLKKENVVLSMVDGDRVEEKNCERQPFGENAVLQFKADIMKEQLGIDFPEISERIVSYPHYLDSVEQLKSHIDELGATNVILVGAVDNHRARQVLHQYYQLQDTIIYLDSANEFSVGEVVVSLKRDKVELSPLRSHYYPDVLTDRSPSASELSCGVVNESAPQHQVTNVAAAHILIAHLERYLFTDLIEGGIEYFHSFKYFARFQPWECI